MFSLVLAYCKNDCTFFNYIEIHTTLDVRGTGIVGVGLLPKQLSSESIQYVESPDCMQVHVVDPLS